MASIRAKIWAYLTLAIIFLLFAFCMAAHAQDCPVGGSPVSHDDSMKNRSIIGKSYKTITFPQLMEYGKDDALPDDFYQVTGYCILVMPGGPETCNCKTADKAKWDTHIEITMDKDHTKATDAVIVEINYRVRDLMKAQGIDWGTSTLKKAMIGHMVTIGGQLFHDDHHWQNSEVDNPHGTDIWRATDVEMHPVTFIKILD